MSVTNPHPWSDDDGSGTTGTPLNNAVLQIIYNDLGPESSITTSTGTQTALAIPAGVGNLTIFLNNASLLSIKGIQAAAVDGQLLSLISVGAGQVDLYHQDVNASASARMILVASVGQTSLAPASGSCHLQYDLTTGRWRLVRHLQGAWITRTFAAGNYTASAGNWTVASASRDAFYLKDCTLLFSVAASGTTSGTPVSTKVTLPNGYSAIASDISAAYIQLSGGGAAEMGYWQPSTTTLNFQRVGNTAFATGTVAVDAVAVFEVQ